MYIGSGNHALGNGVNCEVCCVASCADKRVPTLKIGPTKTPPCRNTHFGLVRPNAWKQLTPAESTRSPISSRND